MVYATHFGGFLYPNQYVSWFAFYPNGDYGLHMDGNKPTTARDAAANVMTATTRNILIEIVRSDTSKNLIARKAGIPLTTFSRKINGHADFTIRELGSVAEALGVPLEALFNLDTIKADVAA